MRISEFLSPQAVVPHLSAQTKPEALKELAEVLCKSYPHLPREKVLDVLRERERLGSTGIGDGVAIPHAKLPGIPSLAATFGVSRSGIDFEACDGKRAHLFFALVAPENSAGLHLKALARISRLFRNAAFRDAILKASTAEEIYALIAQEDVKV